MPFLLNLAELKGYASNLNPLNVFADASVISTQPSTSSPSSSATTPTSKTFPASSLAGPGPSSQASAQQRSSTLGIPSETRATRPVLKNTASSDSSSIEDEAGRRRTSGTSVVIVDPVAEGFTRRRALEPEGARRKRTTSTANGTSSTANGTTRRKKKTNLDTYIIVRPPPTSSKNPLNLQIQLVVKDTRPRERSASGVSVRSSSYSTDVTGSGPTTPTSTDIDLPSATPTALSTESSPASNSKSRPEVESPTRISAEEGDATAGKVDGAALRRSSSLKSSVSSNTSSTGYSGAAKKRVEPMFNLAVHNVMQPTVVTDAATDAKVAKFLKRTLNISGVGILEPSEVWLPAPSVSFSPNLLPANEETLLTPRSRPVSVVSFTSPLSPTQTRLSDNGAMANVRNSFDASLKRTSLDLKNFRLEVGQEGGAKRFFGKIFKKKDHADSVPPPSDPRQSLSNRRSTSPHSDNENGNGVKTSGSVFNGHDQHGHHGHPTFGTAPIIIHRRSSGTIITPEGAVTGLTATTSLPPSSGLSSSPTASSLTEKGTTLPMLPSTRPVGYTWSVKRWAKKNSEGWGAQLVAAAAVGLEMVNGALSDDGDDEVVFEWVKLRVPHNSVGSSIIRQFSGSGAIAPAPKADSKGRRAPSRAGSILVDPSPSPSEVEKKGSFVATPEALTVSLPASPGVNLTVDPRPQPVRRVSATPASGRRSASNPPSILENDHGDNSSVTTHDLTTEDDSDPEDSETPWTCSVWVKKTGQRQLLGTLTPAPHHPKVIAALKIPRSLETVSLAEVKVTGSSQGKVQAEMATRVRQEVCLTEENLKDVVCVTAMWLVAREEFGGLGRKKRSSRA